MGIDVTIESESGKLEKKLDDPRGLTAKLLSKLDGTSSLCLRFVDPYGDTTFNQLQIPILVQEIEDLLPRLTSDELKGHANQILALARDAQKEAHTYLKFWGD